MQIAEIHIDKDRRETTMHGLPDFPMAIYRTVLKDNVLGFINWHRHNELQLCVVEKGEIYFFVNEKKFALKAGEGIFINSNVLHMSKAVEDDSSSFFCFDFDYKLVCGFEGSAAAEKYVLPYVKDTSSGPDCLTLFREVSWQGSILEKLKKIYYLYKDKAPLYEIDISIRFMEIWKLIYINALQPGAGSGLKSGAGTNAASIPGSVKNSASGTNSVPASGMSCTPSFRTVSDTAIQTVQDIMAYVAAHHKEKITLEDIADNVSFSTSECCRIFKRITHETIFSYIQSYRIAESIRLLLETDLPVSEIAAESGFPSPSYYISIFKSKIGKTPHQYRKHEEVRSTI